MKKSFSLKISPIVGAVLAGFLLVLSLPAGIAASTGPASNSPLTSVGNIVFLPLIRHPLQGIAGHVSLNGAPIAGIPLELRFFDGAAFSTLAPTTTGADGGFSFLGVPSLGAGQTYYVRYSNTNGTPGQLWLWATRTLTSYTAGSNVVIGNFDIADIALVSPTDGATVALPFTFLWTPRPATPSDTYEFDLYDPADGNPIFFTDPPLGYVGNYTLNGLPSGFHRNVQYGWEIWVYDPDGGSGLSYETRGVSFSNTSLSGTTTAELMQPKTISDLENRRKK